MCRADFGNRRGSFLRLSSSAILIGFCSLLHRLPHPHDMDAMDPNEKRAAADADSDEHDDKKEKRTSRACLACRKRKSACHL